MMQDVRALVVMLLGAVLAGLASMVYAPSLDPTSVAGYWDGGDFDDVAALMSTTCALALSAAVTGPPPGSPAAAVERVEPGSGPRPARSPASPRAPPRPRLLAG
jgi:hypothetical protein